MDSINTSLSVLNFIGGFSDSFINQTGVDDTASTGENYSSGEYYNLSAQAEIDYTGSSNIGDMTEGGGLASVFDGNLAQTDSTGAQKSGAVTAFVGKDWGSGNTKSITGVKVWGIDTGYNGGDFTVDFLLYGSNSAPTTPVDGTLIKTLETEVAHSESTNPKQYLTGITPSPYRYNWVTIDTNSASDRIWLGEVEFYEGGNGSVMSLVSETVAGESNSSKARGFLIIESGPVPGTNIDLEVSNDGGSTYDTLTGWTLTNTLLGKEIYYADIDPLTGGDTKNYKLRLTTDTVEAHIHGWGVTWL